MSEYVDTKHRKQYIEYSLLRHDQYFIKSAYHSINNE